MAGKKLLQQFHSPAQISVVGLTLVSALVFPASSVFAAGFQVSEHSASGLGRAFSAESSIGDDASIISANPAGLMLIKEKTFTGVLSYIDPDAELKNVDTDLTLTASGTSFDQQGNNGGQFGSDAWVPAFYYAVPVNDRWSYGFSAFTDFALTSDYSSDFSGRVFADKSEVITFNINASFAYRFTDSLSLGFGLNYMTAEGELSSGVYTADDISGTNPAVNNPPSNTFKVEGDDSTFTYTLGLLWELSDKTRFGFGYRSKADLKLEGDATFSQDVVANVPNVGVVNFGNGPFDANVPVTVPEIINLSAYHELNSQFAIHASIYQTRWSRFDELIIRVDSPISSLDEIVTPENWEDSNKYAIGLTYKMDDNLTLRAGLAKDESPIPDEFRTLRIPGSDRDWITLGTTYNIKPNMSVDFGYAYISTDKVSVSEERPINDAISVSIEAESDTSISLYAFQLNYQF